MLLKMYLLLSDRKGKNEPGSLANSGFDLHLAVMNFHDVFDDGQTQSAAALLT